MSSVVQRAAIVALAAFAVFGLHGVAVAAPSGACAEASLHHSQVADVSESNLVLAGVGVSSHSEGIAIPLAIIIGAFLFLSTRRPWAVAPVGDGAQVRRSTEAQHGRSPPRRTQLSVWRN